MKGYINVDKYGTPDILHDLEHFPWPWESDSVDEMILNHVLEHLGQTPEVFIGIMKELYRIGTPDAKIKITVPHPRSDDFINDPTHVRPVTPELMSLFSRKQNDAWMRSGVASNSTLAYYHNVDLEVESVAFKLEEPWRSQLEKNEVRREDIDLARKLYNNVVKDISMVLRVVKDPISCADHAAKPQKKTDDYARGAALLSAGKYIDAAECYEKILEMDQNNADAHNNLGIAYFETGFRDDAIDEFKVATKLAPDHAEAWKNLGKAIRDTGGNPDQAARCFRKSLSIVPDFDDAWMLLGTTLLDRGRCDEAVKCFKKTLELNPEHCDAHSNLLFALNYIPNFSQSEMFAESQKWNMTHTSGIAQTDHIKRDRYKEERLRIGYVSGDFKRHPVGYHLLPVLASHDRELFELYCYATMHAQDDLTEQMQGFAAGWRDISDLTDNDAATLILKDRIDILVDLSGHTKGGRLRLFGRKPAPVQVSWLGYFNTTGVRAIDYLISDETTIPAEEEKWFSERILRLPGSRFCYAPPEYAPPVVRSPVLKNRFITFGSFNNITKITVKVVELWSRVLAAIPDSRLLLKWSVLARKKERERLLKQFAQHGIGDDRLLFRGSSPHAAMLQEYGDIDIALDPFPFSGGMTSCEALWMGVPIITLSADKPAGRQTAAFLRTIGLTELITSSPELFIDKAVHLANDLEKLESIRFELRDKMLNSTLCDGVRFTRNLEELYLQIIQKCN
jgi:protein O-GlcNAc transferase